jgi:predicted double-glycine peptidase
LKYINSISGSKIKIPLPYYTQNYDHTCGETALASILTYLMEKDIDEKNVVDELNIDRNDGLDPYEIVSYLISKKLKFKEFRQMSIPQLKKCIDEYKPVLMMIQAWGDRYWKNAYKHYWKSGHWIVAIGYDDDNFYFEDPTIKGKFRGYIKIDELYNRWHDIENYHSRDNRVHHTEQYGIAIWNDKIKKDKSVDKNYEYAKKIN